MNKKILISTGGTGGHVIPATIFHEHLKNDFKIYISCDRRGSNFLNKEKYDIKIINTPKLTKNLILLPFKFFYMSMILVHTFQK